MMDWQPFPVRQEPLSIEVNAVFDFSDPASVAKADPSSLLAFEVLKTSIERFGPILPGQVREVEATGSIKMAGVTYETHMVFKVALKLDRPPVVEPPDDDVYRRESE